MTDDSTIDTLVKLAHENGRLQLRLDRATTELKQLREAKQPIEAEFNRRMREEVGKECEKIAAKTLEEMRNWPRPKYASDPAEVLDGGKDAPWGPYSDKKVIGYYQGRPIYDGFVQPPHTVNPVYLIKKELGDNGTGGLPV